MKIPFGAVAAAVLGLSGNAIAQDAIVEGPGVKVSEGTVLHPSVGVQTGVISNVFYEDTNPTASPVVQLLAKFALASTTGEEGELDSESRGDPPSVEFRAGLDLLYAEYLSSNSSVTAQRDLAVGGRLHLGLLPKSTVSFAIDDSFNRSTRPTNFESERNLDRDINLIKAQVKYRPSGRSISAGLSFRNTIDIFESSGSQFANRMKNILGARVDWKFLPITRFFVEASYGLISGLGEEATTYKSSSTPLRGVIGTDTAITETTTIRTKAGYGVGFYAGGEDYSGILFALEVGYRYSPMGRFTVEYSKDFKDSINGNFYGEHAIKVGVDQQLDKVSLAAIAATRLRGYRGINSIVGGGPTRDDLIVSAGLRASYVIQDWLAMTAEVDTAIVSTEYLSVSEGLADDPSYVRHQVLAGISAAF
ncbi:MAG: outer membrane beta-barrel protein [Myxococcales bacterium]|nr:outer membrane beta-barrel protein [Myxococcales bacterium]